MREAVDLVETVEHLAHPQQLFILILLYHSLTQKSRHFCIVLSVNENNNIHNIIKKAGLYLAFAYVLPD